jgi:hypothetical protein
MPENSAGSSGGGALADCKAVLLDSNFETFRKFEKPDTSCVLDNYDFGSSRVWCAIPGN